MSPQRLFLRPRPGHQPYGEALGIVSDIIDEIEDREGLVMICP